MRIKCSLAVRCVKIVIGCAAYAVGFDVFLAPYGLNAGGMTGLISVVVHIFGIKAIGAVSLIVNLLLLAISGSRIGKNYFFGSLIGSILVSVLLDTLTLLPVPDVEPLIGAVYGGALCGLGIGLSVSAGASTGGGDIVVRLLKLKYQDVPIGIINTGFDLAVAILSGLVFHDVSKTLYAGISIIIAGYIINVVVYRFTYPKIAVIISKKYKEISCEIGRTLHCGTTFLQGQGGYTQSDLKIIYVAIKKKQVSDLERIVNLLDAEAFVVLQEAQQVFGNGFARYSKNNL